MENNFEIRLLGFLVSAISCIISLSLYLLIINGNGLLDFIEIVYLTFIVVFGIFTYLFLIMDYEM